MLTNNEIFRRAIDTWGTQSQIDMAIEECGELLTALHKLRRNTTTHQIDDVEDEIADVEIMMAQMRLIFNPERIDKRKNHKMLRLLARINEAQQNNNPVKP